jgi:hypothetical protein
MQSRRERWSLSAAAGERVCGLVGAFQSRCGEDSPNLGVSAVGPISSGKRRLPLGLSALIWENVGKRIVGPWLVSISVNPEFSPRAAAAVNIGRPPGRGSHLDAPAVQENTAGREAPAAA